MFEIKDNYITITRGDTAQFKVSVNGAAVDDAVLTVKKNIDDTDEVLQLTAVNSIFYFEPEDTEELDGKYYYDIQIEKDGQIASSKVGLIFIKRGITE